MPLRRSTCSSDKPEDLAHLAQRALAAVADDLADHRRAIAAVALVDLLDDLFAPLVLEVDVDVGRLAPLGAEEALEEQVRARRIDRGDAERVADGAVRRAAAALTEDVAAGAPSRRPRRYAEKVRRDLELGDERELLFDLRANAARDAVRVAPGEPCERQPPELLVGALSGLERAREIDSGARPAKTGDARRARPCDRPSSGDREKSLRISSSERR